MLSTYTQEAVTGTVLLIVNQVQSALTCTRMEERENSYRLESVGATDLFNSLSKLNIQLFEHATVFSGYHKSMLDLREIPLGLTSLTT